ncbi:hypothetical protein GCM10027290_31240 [Micromonospora sonneratiae]
MSDPSDRDLAPHGPLIQPEPITLSNIPGFRAPRHHQANVGNHEDVCDKHPSHHDLPFGGLGPSLTKIKTSVR